MSGGITVAKSPRLQLVFVCLFVSIALEFLGKIKRSDRGFGMKQLESKELYFAGHSCEVC